MSENPIRGFFENRALLNIVDALAIKYGVMPYHILEEMSIYEFSLNVAIFVVSDIESKKDTKAKPVDWGKLGFARTVKKR